MNMIERKIKQLEAFNRVMESVAEIEQIEAKSSIDERLKMVDSAINTFKRQSEELHACTTEQRCQYYNDGWIPADERTPEEKPSMFARLKGTDKWNKAMWEKCSDKVLVTYQYDDGTRETGTASTHDGEWYIETSLLHKEVVAWMPLPEPYQNNEDDKQ